MSVITVIPVNGIGNRLRAMASAGFLSQRLKRDLRIIWEPEHYLPEAAGELFDLDGPLQFVTWKTAEREGLIGEGDIKLYLNETEEFITLRGYDRGEQRFSKAFASALKRSPKKPAVVMAGGLFHPSANNLERAGSRLRKARILLGNTLRFSDSIMRRFLELQPGKPYIGVSLRGSDLGHLAPEADEQISSALNFVRKMGGNSVFASSEDQTLLGRAEEAFASEGIDFLFNRDGNWKNSIDMQVSRVPISGQEAFADYLVLRNAVGYVGPKASSFVTETAVHFPDRKAELL